MSVIGSLSFESQIASSLAAALSYTSTTDMVNNASGREFGVIMILMSVGMLSGFVILLMLPVSIITSRIMWKKGKIQVVDNPAMAPAAEETAE